VKGKEGDAIWVCVDCFYTHHGIFEEEEHGTPDKEPLSLIGDDVEVTSGVLEHDEDCPNIRDGKWVGESDETCEEIEFSHSACHGCGSTLGGSRHALTIWTDTEEVA
jgi:ribosomal protein L37AE/L43A